MPLLADATERRTRRWEDLFLVWNRKLHFYLGLYLLFFVWLFAFTGLLINHSSWKFAEFWPNRKVSSSEHPIQRPSSGDPTEQARDLMRQLGVQGEIEWSAAPPVPGRMEFRAARPGQIWEIAADFQQGRARVQRTAINAWGIVRVLHTFTGVRVGDSRNQRDWILTGVWAISMDAVAAGLILMVLSSLVMWYQLRLKRTLGLIALGAGSLICGWIVFALRWI